MMDHVPPHDRFPCPTRCSRLLWLRPVLVSLVGAALLAGCGADAGGSANGGARPSTTVRASIDPESGAASLGSEPRLGTSLQPTPQPTPPATSSAAATTPTTSASTPSVSKTSAATSPATTAPSGVRWPKALGEPQHGQPVWAVYLATGHSAGDAAIELAVRQAATVGYHAVVGDVACDEGAMKALGLDQYDFWSAATLYFARQADAGAFVSAYTARVRPPRGVAKVNIGCLD